MANNLNSVTERYDAQLEQMTSDNQGLTKQILEYKQLLADKLLYIENRKKQNIALAEQLQQAEKQRKVLEIQNAQLQGDLMTVKELMWVEKTQHGEKVETGRVMVERIKAALVQEKEQSEAATQKLENQTNDLKNQIDSLEDRTRKELALVRRTIEQTLSENAETRERSLQQSENFKLEIERCQQQEAETRVQITSLRECYAQMERQLNELVEKKQLSIAEVLQKAQLNRTGNITPEQEMMLQTQVWNKKTVEELQALLGKENETTKKQILDCDVEIQACQLALKKRQHLETELVAILDQLEKDTDQAQRVNERLRKDIACDIHDVEGAAAENDALVQQLDNLKKSGISAPLRHILEDAPETSPTYLSAISQTPHAIPPIKAEAPYLEQAKELESAVRHVQANRNGGFTNPDQVIEELAQTNVRLYAKLQQHQRAAARIYNAKAPGTSK